MLKIGILGGGNGAFAAAAHLGREGHQIRIFSPFAEELDPIIKKGGIILKGCIGEHFVKGIQVCKQIAGAVKDADIVMVIVPANFHAQYAQLLASLLEGGQILFLNPGHTGGALGVKQVLKDQCLEVKIILVETNTLTYITRKTGYNEVTIFKVNNNVIFSALPACDTSTASQKIKALYPRLTLADSVLETSLANFNAVMHPPVMILNTALIERTKGDLYFYSQGTTPAVGKVIEALDKERMVILKALGLPLTSFLDFFYQTGCTTKDAYESGSYYRVVKDSPPNAKIKAPDNLKHRFLEEDICCGLVPMVALGNLYGVDTPLMAALITLASVINGKNYLEEGLNKHVHTWKFDIDFL
ncbi:Opine dehydrogenase [subsurface metagenome]